MLGSVLAGWLVARLAVVSIISFVFVDVVVVVLTAVLVVVLVVVAVVVAVVLSHWICCCSRCLLVFVMASVWCFVGVAAIDVVSCACVCVFFHLLLRPMCRCCYCCCCCCRCCYLPVLVAVLSLLQSSLSSSSTVNIMSLYCR